MGVCALGVYWGYGAERARGQEAEMGPLGVEGSTISGTPTGDPPTALVPGVQRAQLREPTDSL